MLQLRFHYIVASIAAILLLSLDLGRVEGAPAEFHNQVAAGNPLLWYKLSEPSGNAVNFGSLGALYDSVYFGTANRSAPTIGGDTGVGFNSTDDYLESLGASPLVGNPTFSIETLVFLPVGGTAALWGPFLHWGDGGGGDGAVQRVGREVYFSVQNNNLNRTFAGFYNAGVRTTSPEPLGEWLHIVWTRAGGNDSTNGTTLYINGASVALQQDPNLNPGFVAAAGIDVNSTTFRINRGRDFLGTRHFAGTMDEIALYNRVLTPTEILNHACSIGLCEATRYWRDNAGNGNWSDPSKWSSVSAADTNPASNGVPLAGEPVNIVHTDGAQRTVTYDVNAPTLGLVRIDLTGSGTAADMLSITTNHDLSANGIFVGEHTGNGTSGGRGALFQTAGTVTIIPGSDLVVGHGTGSTGIYTLSGAGALTANQSEHIGLSGTGTFHHLAGMNTITPGAVGSFKIGVNAGSTGTYNLSGTGELISNKSETVGDQGVGVFNHTGGSNKVQGAGNDLQLGNAATGNGTYAISNDASLNVANNLAVGVAGTGTLTIQNLASVHVNNALNINSASMVNLNGGTLRVNSIGGSGGLSKLNYVSGTIQLGGNRTVGGPAGDAIISGLFGTNPVINAGKNLKVEGTATLGATLMLNGGTFSANQVINPQLVQVQHGTFEVADQAATIGPGQTLELADDARINYGLGITNQGVIKGGGVLGGGAFQNAALGEVRAEANKTISFAAENHENEGKFLMSGGSLNFTEQLINQLAGKIDGHGTINVDGDMVNHGEINVAEVMEINANALDGRFMNLGEIDVQGSLKIAAANIELDGQMRVAQNKALNLITTATAQIAQGIISGVVQLDGGTMSANNGLLFGTPQLNAQAESVVSAIPAQVRENYNQVQQNIADFAAAHANQLQQLPATEAAELQTLIQQHQTTSQTLQGIVDALNACHNCVGNFRSTIIADTEVLGTIIAGGTKGIGNVEFVGDLAMEIGSSLELELSGVNQGQFDKINVDGIVSFEIGANMVLAMLDPSDLQNGTNLFLPAIGNSFDVISADAIDAEFIMIDGPAYADRSFVAGVVNTASGQSLRITVVPIIGLPGDYNQNGVVDAADYVVWRNNLGSGTPLPNDNSPGVDLSDYNVWRAHFGQTAASGNAAAADAPSFAVPEPATVVLLILTTALTLFGRYRATVRVQNSLSRATRQKEGVGATN
jgi:T5SS/PEP-CTERM-associated repeat protein